MSEIVIRAEHVYKQYRLGVVQQQTLAAALNSWWFKIRGKSDPNTKINVNPPVIHAGKHLHDALRDINFEVKRGECLGIIGKNGAGKSTLLKILSRVTTPTKGKLMLKGTVASLLEVGTGFHPELTGKENIFLNGAILGMSKSDIQKKYDEILAFAEVEKYIDTPVKRYSSGMYVRLAFAVAAHLEPDVLVVDEVLAVGDAAFQKKCLGKMNEANHKDGRTVIFVSHHMPSIQSLTQNCMLLYEGSILRHGPTHEVVHEYMVLNQSRTGLYKAELTGDRPQIIEAEVITSELGYMHNNGQPFEIRITLHQPTPIPKVAISVQIYNTLDVAIVHTWYFDAILQQVGAKKVVQLTCQIPSLKLYMGNYYCKIILASHNGREILEVLNQVCYFCVQIKGLEREYPWEPHACTYLEDFTWTVTQ